jgi:hypothetical protein
MCDSVGKSLVCRSCQPRRIPGSGRARGCGKRALERLAGDCFVEFAATSMKRS